MRTKPASLLAEASKYAAVPHLNMCEQAMERGAEVQGQDRGRVLSRKCCTRFQRVSLGDAAVAKSSNRLG